MIRWLVALSAGVALAGCGDSQATSSAASTPATTATATPTATATELATPTAAPTEAGADCPTLLADEQAAGRCETESGSVKVAGAGRPTVLGDIGLQVKSVRLAKTVPAGYEGAKTLRATGRFAILRVRVANHGRKPLDWGNEVDGRTLLLIGDRSFAHDTEAELNLPGSLDNVGRPIPPGEGRDLWMVYRVSKGSVADVRQGLVAFVTTAQLAKGDTPDSASQLGLARVPGG